MLALSGDQRKPLSGTLLLLVRDEQPVSRHIAAFFAHGLNLGHGGIVWQAGLFAEQRLLNLGAKPIVVA